MEAQVEYFKYTTALAVGLLLYLPSTFIPTASTLEFAVLCLAWLVTLVSVLTGILFYTRATTIAASGGSGVGDAAIKRWGWWHLSTLILCFLAAAGFFIVHKMVVPQFFAGPAPIACTTTLTDPSGVSASFAYPCTPP